MLYLLLAAIWFGLPGAIADLTPPLALKLFPRLSRPLDFKKKYKGKRILGWEKTVSWVITGLIFAHLTFVLQTFYLVETPNSIFADINPNILTLPWYYGLAIGMGAIGFDIVKSFFKRQKGIKPGKLWYPYDQTSWVVGVVVIQSMFFNTGLFYVTITFISGLILHLLVELFNRFIKADRSIL